MSVGATVNATSDTDSIEVVIGFAAPHVCDFLVALVAGRYRHRVRKTKEKNLSIIVKNATLNDYTILLADY